MTEQRLTAEEKLIVDIIGRVVNAPCSFGHTNPVRMCSSCGPWPDPLDLVRAYAAHVSGALTWMEGEPPYEELLIAEIAFNFSGNPMTERIVCMVDETDALRSECGDDIGWDKTAIKRWVRFPTIQVGRNSG